MDLIVDIAVSQKVQTSQKYTDYTIWHNIHHKWLPLWYFLTNSQPPPLLLLLSLFLVFPRWTVCGLVGVTLLRTPVYPRPSRRRAFSSSAPPLPSWLPSVTRSLPISWHRLPTFLPSLGPAVVSKVVSMPKASSLRWVTGKTTQPNTIDENLKRYHFLCYHPLPDTISHNNRLSSTSSHPSTNLFPLPSYSTILHYRMYLIRPVCSPPKVQQKQRRKLDIPSWSRPLRAGAGRVFAWSKTWPSSRQVSPKYKTKFLDRLFSWCNCAQMHVIWKYKLWEMNTVTPLLSMDAIALHNVDFKRFSKRDHQLSRLVKCFVKWNLRRSDWLNPLGTLVRVPWNTSTMLLATSFFFSNSILVCRWNILWQRAWRASIYPLCSSR